jgi:hypothetical protein
MPVEDDEAYSGVGVGVTGSTRVSEFSVPLFCRTSLIFRLVATIMPF